MELKKNENRDLRKFRTLFRNVGLVIVLLITITAFEWKWEEVKIYIPKVDIEFDTIFSIPPTVVDLPPAPEPPKPESKVKFSTKIKIIDDGDKIKTDPVITQNPAPIDLTKLIVSNPEPEDDLVVYNDVGVDVKALPAVGYKEWYKNVSIYCSNNRAGSHKMRRGKVYVSFVIEKDGTVSGFKIMKGVHKRIDALAINAIINSGKWIPAKMGVRKVRQRMIIPISFE